MASFLYQFYTTFYTKFILLGYQIYTTFYTKFIPLFMPNLNQFVYQIYTNFYTKFIPIFIQNFYQFEYQNYTQFIPIAYKLIPYTLYNKFIPLCIPLQLSTLLCSYTFILVLHSFFVHYSHTNLYTILCWTTPFVPHTYRVYTY